MPLMIIPIGLDPVLFRLGTLALRWYGLMYVVGIAVALWVVLPYVRKRVFLAYWLVRRPATTSSGTRPPSVPMGGCS